MSGDTVGDGILGGEGRHEFVGADVEQRDVHHRGNAAADGVFDELNERSVFAAGELFDEVAHGVWRGDDTRQGELVKGFYRWLAFVGKLRHNK